MTALNPIDFIDAYKIDHRRMYPEGTEYVYSNLTPRGSRVSGVTHLTFFGLQGFLKRVLGEMFDAWFQRDEDEVCAEYERRILGILGPNEVGSGHIRALHRKGFLPLVFRALPEGTRVPMRLPVFTVENTDPEFFWLTNYIETMLSAETWMPSTSATLAVRMRELLDDWASATGGAPQAVDFQSHDFSFRGMSSIEAAGASGAGHLLSFAGTDSVVTLNWIEKNYEVEEGTVLGMSVPATEHSVMCAGGAENEEETFRRLLNLYPSGIVSVVSDSWDLWKVLTEMLPAMKDEIMARDGKLVIRPDSGDPAEILCGYEPETEVEPNGVFTEPYAETPDTKGVIELLWGVFGGRINDKGYKELDSHIGTIYGDAITYERANDICQRLEEKGFASTNVVFGVGSFTYQYNTRDTFGFAMKATQARINGEWVDLFKDPVTDNGMKKSAKGRLAVVQGETDLELIEMATHEQEKSSLLELVWRNGEFIKEHSWNDIVARVGKRLLK